MSGLRSTTGSASFKLTGFKELEQRLLALPKELAEHAEQGALRAGMVPVRKAAAANAGAYKDTGLLQKSIGLTVRRVRRKLQYVNRYTARVGARTGFRQQVTRIVKREMADGTYKVRFVKQMADPTKYAHLVELGTSKIAARPYIRNAMETAEPEIISEMAKGYNKGLAKALAKLRKK